MSSHSSSAVSMGESGEDQLIQEEAEFEQEEDMTSKEDDKVSNGESGEQSQLESKVDGHAV